MRRAEGHSDGGEGPSGADMSRREAAKEQLGGGGGQGGGGDSVKSPLQPEK